MHKYKTLRVAGALAALAAAGAAISGGTVAAADVAKGPETTIKIKGNAHPRFEGPEAIPYGTDLQVMNKTDPQEIGPHTFSLVEKPVLPKGAEELKKCAHLKLICRKIAVAHEVDFETFEVGEPNVENGNPGWDASFDGTNANPGDTWYTETQGETTSREVIVEGNMWFMCAIHPDMQSKVKVLPLR